MVTECCGSEGIFGKIALDVTASVNIGNFGVGSPSYPLIQGGVTLSQKTTLVNPGESGTNGFSAELAEQTRQGLVLVGGDINLALSPDSWDFFAWRALGGNWGAGVTGTVGQTNTSFPVPGGDSIPTFHSAVHKDKKVYLYENLVINQLEVSGQVGESMKMKMSCLGVSRVGLYQPSVWPSGLLPSDSVPYMFEDCVLLIDGTTYGMRSFTFTRNNNLEPRYYGKRSPCGFRRSGMAKTMLKLSLKHCADELQNLFLSKRPPEYFDVKLVFSHPNQSASYAVKIQMPGVQWPDDDAAISGPGEIMLDLDGMCRRAGGNPEVNFYSDNA